MHIKAITLKNLGPVDDVRINFRIDEDNFVPVVLVGQNGTGKSLTLSTILDGMTEIRRTAFRKMSEVEADSYAKISTKRYIRRSAPYSHAKVEFSIGSHEVSFNEVVNQDTFDNFAAVAPELVPVVSANHEFRDTGFLKHVNVPSDCHKEITETNYSYFPHFRYERSSWMAESAKVEFVKNQKFLGQADINPIKTSIIDETRKWILNILLDRSIYELNVVNIEATLAGDHKAIIPMFAGFNGPNEQLFQMVSEVITLIVQTKTPDVVSARIGVGRKGSREISVYITRSGRDEEILAPDIDMLSSGELMILSMVFEIIRSYEVVTGGVATNLLDVTGIAIIDEIDLHLHISLQKTVLPKLIRRLPKVQFVITTHSPFFVLGMQETGPVDIISMPIGNIIEPEDYSEFQETYDIFVSKNQQFKSRYELLSAKIAENNKPLIVTEGKTDWQHLKHSLLKFKAMGQYTDLDVDFFEFDDSVDMGHDRLKQMCESMSLIHRDRKMIFVFDRDDQKMINAMSGAPGQYRYLGNNVFSFCIPVPAHRVGYTNISIEMYYTDADMATPEPTSGKRLWFSNNIRSVSEPNVSGSIIEAYTPPNPATELTKKVHDANIDRIVNAAGEPVAISKAAFTSRIACVDDVSSHFDRSAFSAIFEVVNAIVAHTDH